MPPPMPKAARGFCFVISPIGDPNSPTRLRTEKVAAHIILPATKAAGYAEENVKRADQLHLPGIITSQVIDRLMDAELVIADLTDHNPNVFYELAVRHAKRAPIVLLIEKGQPIPFDLIPNRVIHYDLNDWNSPRRCVEELHQQIEAVLQDPASAYNPISAAIDLANLSASSDPLGQIVATLLPRLEALDYSMQSIRTTLQAYQSSPTSVAQLSGFGPGYTPVSSSLANFFNLDPEGQFSDPAFPTKGIALLKRLRVPTDTSEPSDKSKPAEDQNSNA